MSACRMVLDMLALVVVLNHAVAKKYKVTHDLSECNTNRDCAKHMVCTDNMCVDPCETGVCGQHSLCYVSDHVAKCACEIGYAGHPFSGCVPAPPCLTDCNNATAEISRTDNNKTFYLYYTTKLNWYQSVSHCNSLGMRLLTINSQEKQDELVHLIKETNATGNWWIGASDLGQLGDYIWMTSGTPNTYTNFHAKQPDNHINHNGAVEHCVEVHTSWDYEWNDYLCEYHQYHVCEKYQ